VCLPLVDDFVESILGLATPLIGLVDKALNAKRQLHVIHSVA
jgi:hypothetical protein